MARALLTGLNQRAQAGGLTPLLSSSSLQQPSGAPAIDVIGVMADSLGAGIILRDQAVDLNWPGVRSWGTDTAGAGYHTIRSALPFMVPNGDNRTADRLNFSEYFGKAYFARTDRIAMLVVMAVPGTRMFVTGHSWTPGDATYEAFISEANLALTAAKAVNPDSQYVGTLIWGLTNDAIYATSNPGTITASFIASSMATMIADIRSRVTGASSSWVAMAGMDRELLKADATNKIPVESGMRLAHRDGTNIAYVPTREGDDSGDQTHVGLAGMRYMGAALDAALADTAPTVTVPSTWNVFAGQPLRVPLTASGSAVASWVIGGTDAASFEWYEEFFDDGGSLASQRVTDILRKAGGGNFASTGSYSITIQAKSSGGKLSTAQSVTVNVLAAYGSSSTGAVTAPVVSNTQLFASTAGLSSTTPNRYNLTFGAGLNFIFVSQSSGTLGPLLANGVTCTREIGLSTGTLQIYSVALAQGGSFPLYVYGSGTMNNPNFTVFYTTNSEANPFDTESLQNSGTSITSKSFTLATGGMTFSFGYGQVGDAATSPSVMDTGPGVAFGTFVAHRASTGTVQVTGSSGGRGLFTMALNQASSGLTVSPPLLTNSQTFYGPQLNLNVAPALLTNSQSFFGPQINLVVLPPMLSNGQTFYGPQVNVTVTPPLVTNSQSFFGANLNLNVSPPLLSNSQSFFGAQLNLNIAPPLLSNSQAFFSPTITSGTTISMPLVSNAQVFYAPTITRGPVSIAMPLLSNASAFFGFTIGGGTAAQTYPLAGVEQTYPLEGVSQQYPLQ